MNSYYSKLLKVLPEGNLERRTDITTGHEAIYKDGKLLFSDSEDAVSKPDLTESIVAEPHLVLFGSGHVGKALYDLAVLQDMKVTVFDSRSELLTQDRFPKATRIVGEYDEILSKDYEDFHAPYYCIFTHGHLHDEQCLLYALRHPHAYIGMIGSKAKVAHCMEIVRDSDITDDMLTKLHTPIGLSINAVTPQEIAISIMAQIVSVFRTDKNAVTIDTQIVRKAASERGIMARIIKKDGSSPRSVGSMIFVTENDFIGTVGGGAVERIAIDRSRELLKKNERLLVEHYSLKPTGPLNMTCGGENTIMYKLIV